MGVGIGEPDVVSVSPMGEENTASGVVGGCRVVSTGVSVALDWQPTATEMNSSTVAKAIA